MSFIEQYLLQLNTEKRRWRRAAVILTALSIIVALVTVWNLRMTGVTIANSASCGIEEHRHTAECIPEAVLTCTMEALPEETAPITEPTTEATEITGATGSAEITEATEATEMAGATGSAEGTEATEATEMTGATGSAEVTEATEPVEVIRETEPVHTHTDECYTTVYACGKEDHVHQISCFSVSSADVETGEIWEATLPELTGKKADDMVLIAQSQLGYRESENNFTLAADGISKSGITRYGQWYGNPYGDWANMFTSFCLRYAGFPEDLLNSGAEVMRISWEEADLYRSFGGYAPAAGDIVFLDKNGNGTVETTAIVLKLENGVLTVIEGDVENQVVQTEYTTDTGMVIGFGIAAPENRVLMSATSPTATGTMIGNTATYSSNLLTQGGSFIIYTAGTDGKYYALDGNGKAAQIQIDGSGTIYADVSDQNSLYWTFEKANNYDNRPAYYIQNVATGKYLHPNRDSGTYGPIHPDRWETALYTNGSGVRIRGARQDAYVQLSGAEYTISNTQNNGSTMYFGRAPTAINLWLDGTNGNLMSYRGSSNTKHTVYTGVAYQLPSQWKSPTKYSYKLMGVSLSSLFR